MLRVPTVDFDAAAAHWVGRMVGGRFRIDEPLGEGGLAVVYRAEHVELGRPVALKVLHAELEAHGEARQRFEREARALASLVHPNVVTLIDFGLEGGTPYLVMELLEGESLETMLAREGTLDPGVALSVVRQVLRALAYAHGRGLVHRDIKPGNVFVQRLNGELHVKLLDFGLAKFLERESRAGHALTRAGTVSGTPAYMAPEQAGAFAADGRADLYATGVVLFEMLAGRCPFVGSSSEVMRAKLTTDPPDVSAVRPDAELPPGLGAVVRCALARDPAHRFASAEQMLEALDGVGGGRIASRTGASSGGAERRPEGQARTAAMVALLAAAFAVAAGVTAGGTALLVRALVTDEADTAPTAESAPAREGAPVEDARAEEDDAPQAPSDPWAAADTPEVLRAARERVEAGHDIDDAMRADLFRYASQHPDGPRPQLLLGHVYASRHWSTDALSRYEAAYRIDRNARHDPRVLENLIAIIATHRRLADRASDAVERWYGDDALAAIDDALAGGEIRGAGALRLRALRERLDSP